jgi:hypothetical protein
VALAEARPPERQHEEAERNSIPAKSIERVGLDKAKQPLDGDERVVPASAQDLLHEEIVSPATDRTDQCSEDLQESNTIAGRRANGHPRDRRPADAVVERNRKTT